MMKSANSLLLLTLTILTNDLFAQKTNEQLDKALVGEWVYLFSKDINGAIEQSTHAVLQGFKRHYYANGTLTEHSPFLEKKINELSLNYPNSRAKWSTSNGTLTEIHTDVSNTAPQIINYQYRISGDTLVIITFKGNQSYWLKRNSKKQK